MKRFPLFLLFTLITLSTVPAQADIIDDTIGNIQQAINDAYNPDRGRDYEDSRDDGWQREVSDDRRRQYDDRRRQFEDRRRQLDERQRQLDQERQQLEDEERRMEDEYGRGGRGRRGYFPSLHLNLHPIKPRLKPRRQCIFHQPRIKLVADMGQNHTWRADNLIQRKHGI